MGWSRKEELGVKRLPEPLALKSKTETLIRKSWTQEAKPERMAWTPQGCSALQVGFGV